MNSTTQHDRLRFPIELDLRQAMLELQECAHPVDRSEGEVGTLIR